jgi:hypothetical protein
VQHTEPPPGPAFDADALPMFDTSHVLPAYVGPRVASIVGSCAVLVDGNVKCFEGGGFPAGSSAKPSALGYYAQDGRGCFATADGGVWCWGKLLSHVRDPGQACRWEPWPPMPEDLAAVEVDDRRCPSFGGFYYCGFDQLCGKPVQLARIDQVVSLVGHQDDYCALRKNGEVRCWGPDLYYPISFLKSSKRPRCTEPPDAQNTGLNIVCRDPTRVVGLPPLVSISMYDDQGCGLTREGRLYCWGSLPETFARSLPDSAWHLSDGAEQTAWPRLKQITVSSDDTCGIALDGQVLCQRGRAERPEPIAGFEDAVELRVDWRLMCIRDASGGVLCSTPPNASSVWRHARRVPSLSDTVGLSVENGRACAVRRDGAAYCWGHYS